MAASLKTVREKMDVLLSAASNLAFASFSL
jgi:hypothetical protein